MSADEASDGSSLPTSYFKEKTAETIAPPPGDEKTEKPTVNNDDDKPIKSVSHDRRVHFPADDAHLCEISIAPEPLSNQPLVSLGVILQRYRATCQRLQLRTIPGLLEQLNTMDDGRKSFYDRLDRLTIINEKIDVKHIDALEEILSRCRFHTIDFEGTFLDDATLAQLVDVLEYYESCTHLNLSNHRSISFQGYQALTKYLRRTRCLERLDMNSVRFDDTQIVYLTRSLRLSTTLYELHIESCQLNGKLLQIFIQNLRTCSCLRELYLCDNRLQVQDSIVINELIRTCGQFLFLLDLRSNPLQDNGMSHIASQLSQYDENHLDGNSLHKISFQATQLTQQGVGFLAKSLLHNRTLRSLDLSHNNITNEGLFLLRDALLTNRTITELVLRNCCLTDQAAIALAEFIAESTTIQYIDLRENNFQASGICGMAIAIKNNKSLLKLDFDPIVSTPTYYSAQSTKNNIDRTNNSNSLLSLSNLRRMTTGFGSFTSVSSPSSTLGGGGTRELLEQKARWMSDIAAVCQRNLLIYEEQLRTEDGTADDSTIASPEDIELKEQSADPALTNGQHAVTNDDAAISTLPEAQQGIPIHNNHHANELSAETPVNDGDHVEQPTKELGFSNGNQDQTESIHGDEASSSSNLATAADLPLDFPDDEKRKLHHSDSFHLIRRKAKNKMEHSNEVDDSDQDDEQHSALPIQEQEKVEAK